MTDPARATRILTQIDPRSWEHPADRAALNALRRIPVFDQVLRTLFGFFGEKPLRLAFLSGSVRVSETQYGRVHRLYADACQTLDAPRYPLYVQQNVELNAFAFGMQQPFIVLNSATVQALDDDELRFILGHEVGHVLSGHSLYLTMMRILIQLSHVGFPIVGLVATPVLLALQEWHRKAELSCDRAGILAVQNPEPALRTMMAFAGGKNATGNLDEFMRQAEEYRETSDIADQVFKVLNVLWLSHPAPVLRAAEMRTWFESGGYERILAGEYRRRGEPDSAYAEDLRAAGQSYREAAREGFTNAQQAARRVVDSFRQGFGARE
ncbi:M48 family metallopeptidase [Longimicrobium terrae]|uniref:Zn-dependent protease with chaperone function n=1 Tax=Longimicrobium terrae TaxID=1639882 RepID=A0A841H549_9BACT|nr:M48 family metallopeptidase [Longimicrobium terrae]MBB4638865.1 Zn-dependent protease with chaperone function [Longimicrobium terrae]MBB6073104.1 Zn-dependent protease with chaperone function [Longimicrobium terrae]NNC30205.1 M48 family metallopeptidase [Longimicrobium terrae]